MPDAAALLDFLLVGIARPLLRLLVTMTLGLTVATVIESLGWTRILARLAAPVTRLARFGPDAAASFSLAFVSPASANATLARARDDGALSRKELVLANLLNATPSFLVHLPSLYALSLSLIGAAANTYVGLILAAAMLRTALTAVVGRLTLPLAQETDAPKPQSVKTRGATITLLLSRLRRRVVKAATYTVPVYCAVVILQQAGAFGDLERWLAGNDLLSGLFSPAVLGIAVLGLVAETGPALAAAAAVLDSGGATRQEVILALLAGTVLASPMRALRHQLPSYAGFYRPATALLLVGIGQSVRAVSLVVVAVLYALWG